MLISEKLSDVVFGSFDEAHDFVAKRQYDTLVVNSADCRLEPDGILIGSTKYPMYDVYVDAIFGVTGLPRRNEAVLPVENVVKDVNTLFENGNSTFAVRILDGRAYTMFKANSKGIRQPLTHTQFLDTLAENVVTNTVKNVVLAPKFMRVSTFDETQSVEVLPGDIHHFGLDFVNGEVYKSFPLTIGLMAYRTSCSNSAVAPLEEKYIKLKASEDTNGLRKRFAEVAATYSVNYDWIKERIRTVADVQVTADILKYITSGVSFFPAEVKDKLFSHFYERDEDGKVTKIVRPEAIDGLNLFTLYNEITREAHENALLDQTARYKAEYFAGSLLDSNNKMLNQLI